MALTVNHPLLKEVRVPGFIVDSAAASSVAYTVSPIRGKIVKIEAVAGAAVDSDRVLTCNIAGTAITGGAITMVAAASAAGSVFSVVPTAANICNEGDYLGCTSDAAGSTACPTQLIYTIQMV